MEIRNSNQRSISFKKSATKTSIKHNNREFKETDWNTKYHEHIDRERSKDNVYLIQKDIREVYDELFGESVEEYNAKQTRNDRKIDDYFSHVNKSKTLNLQQEFIIQIGDAKDFAIESDAEKIKYMFNTLGNNLNDDDKANTILKEYVKDFERRNPNLKIYNAVIHNDEASPHLHMNVVPVATGYKRGVNKQPSFHKAIKQQGIEVESDRDAFQIFREREVKELERLMNKQGWERKQVGTNHIRDVKEYKQAMSEVQSLQVKSNQLRQEIKNKEYELHKREIQNSTMSEQLKTMISLKNTLGEKGKWKSYSDEMKIEQAKEYFPNPLNKADKLEKAEKILELKDRASATNDVILASNAFLRTDSTNISKAIENGLERKLEPFKSKIEKLESENEKLRKENEVLTSQNSCLKCSLSILKTSIRETIQKVSKTVSEAFFEHLGANMKKSNTNQSPIELKDGEEQEWVRSGIFSQEKKQRKRTRSIDLEL